MQTLITLTLTGFAASSAPELTYNRGIGDAFEVAGKKRTLPLPLPVREGRR
jgi:hypothetical protein